VLEEFGKAKDMYVYDHSQSTRRYYSYRVRQTPLRQGGLALVSSVDRNWGSRLPRQWVGHNCKKKGWEARGCQKRSFVLWWTTLIRNSRDANRRTLYIAQGLIGLVTFRCFQSRCVVKVWWIGRNLRAHTQ